jgi:hypothetical protein
MFLLTGDDDFNALCSAVLGAVVDGPIYRLRPPSPNHGVVAPYTGGDVLFDQRLNRIALTSRYQAGARILIRRAEDPTVADGHDLLFAVRPDGQLDPMTRTSTVTPQPGDMVVLLGPATAGDKPSVE